MNSGRKAELLDELKRLVGELSEDEEKKVREMGVQELEMYVDRQRKEKLIKQLERYNIIFDDEEKEILMEMDYSDLHEKCVDTIVRLKMESGNKIKTYVNQMLIDCSNSLVGLENLLNKNGLLQLDATSELLKYLKRGLDLMRDYLSNRSKLDPSINPYYEDWIRDEDNKYPRSFESLVKKLEDINKYLVEGFDVLDEMKEEKVFERLALSALENENPYDVNLSLKDIVIDTVPFEVEEPKAVLRSYNISFNTIMNKISKILEDPFRRSTTVEIKVLKEAKNNYHNLLSEFNEYWDSIVAEEPTEENTKEVNAIYS